MQFDPSLSSKRDAPPVFPEVDDLAGTIEGGGRLLLAAIVTD